MQARPNIELVRSGLRLDYEGGRLSSKTPINVMGPRGPEQYFVDWKVTWDVGTSVTYKDNSYTVEGYDLAHDNQGGLWPDVVLKGRDDLLLHVDPVATMDGNPPTFVHNLSTVDSIDVQYVETAEVKDVEDN